MASLEEQLVAVALRLLREEPGERFSMRRVAQELGVSHQAPYVHFGNKRRFLAAVAGTGLHEAASKAARAVQAAGSDPAARLHALADAYVGFARDDPQLHDLAYGPLVAKADHPRLQQAATEYWDLLHDTVAACQPRDTAEGEVLRRSAAAWGTVYGLARLTAWGQFPASVPGDHDGLVHDAVETMRHGWLA